MSYPSPETQRGQKYSSFTYYHTGERRPSIVTCRNVAHREMLYCSNSSGEVYEQRAKELKPYQDNIVEGIIANAHA